MSTTVHADPDTGSAPAAVAAAIERADLIVRRARGELAWIRWHCRAEYERGWRAGYDRACADLEDDWHQFTNPVAHGRDPAAGRWERRLAAAEAHERRQAWAHEQDFSRRAFEDPPELRSGPQRAAVWLLGKRRGGAA